VIATAPKEHAGRAYWLTGPSLITYTDIAEELSAALGHPVDYRQISPAEHRAAMIQAGIPEAVATSNALAFGLIAEGDAAWLSDDVTSITGTAPRPLPTRQARGHRATRGRSRRCQHIRERFEIICSSPARASASP
jgi:hypothetical protein